MGECGCDLVVTRCRDHADDVAIVLTRDVAQAAMGWLTWCSYQGTPPATESHEKAGEAARAFAVALSEEDR